MCGRIAQRGLGLGSGCRVPILWYVKRMPRPTGVLVVTLEAGGDARRGPVRVVAAGRSGRAACQEGRRPAGRGAGDGGGGGGGAGGGRGRAPGGGARAGGRWVLGRSAAHR